MRNYIKWETIDAEHVLDVDVELNLILEVVTLLNFLLDFIIYFLLRVTRGFITKTDAAN